MKFWIFMFFKLDFPITMIARGRYLLKRKKKGNEELLGFKADIYIKYGGIIPAHPADKMVPVLNSTILVMAIRFRLIKPQAFEEQILVFKFFAYLVHNAVVR